MGRLVADVPSSLVECEACRVGSCLRRDWEKCPWRLATMELVLVEEATRGVRRAAGLGDPRP